MSRSVSHFFRQVGVDSLGPRQRQPGNVLLDARQRRGRGETVASLAQLELDDQAVVALVSGDAQCAVVNFGSTGS